MSMNQVVFDYDIPGVLFLDKYSNNYCLQQEIQYREIGHAIVIVSLTLLWVV